MGWRNVLRHRDIPWLVDQTLGGSVIFPAAGHLSLGIEAIHQVCENDGIEMKGITLRDVDIKTALVVPDTDDGIEIRLRLSETHRSEKDSTWYGFAIESITDGAWTLHCEGKISPIAGPARKDPVNPADCSKLTQRVPSRRWYDAFKRVGFEYGPSFQKLGPIRTNNKLNCAAAGVRIVTESGLIEGESRYILHPSIVDACMQLINISVHKGMHKEMPWGVVPISIEVSFYLPSEGFQEEGSAIAWTDDVDGRQLQYKFKVDSCRR